MAPLSYRLLVESLLFTCAATIRIGPLPAKDAYSVYDGHDLLQVKACNAGEVSQLRLKMARASCRILSEPGDLLLPHDGSCAVAQYTCPTKVSALKPRGDGIEVLADGSAGELMRRHGAASLAVPLQHEDGRVELRGNLVNQTFYLQFRNYDDILAYITSLVKASKAPAQIVDLKPTTIEGRQIKVVRIRGKDWVPGDPRMTITHTIHAREWISTMAGVYSVERSLEKFAADPEKYAKMEMNIVPVSNPDGFMYSITQDRFWRKNCGEYEGCYGVDLNRNFNWQWGRVDEPNGNEVTTCNEVFHGDYGASEPEVKALQGLVEAAPISVHLDFHSCGGFILGPWSFTTIDHPRQKEILALGGDMKKAIASHAGSQYEFCTGNRCLYTVSGDLPDYATAMGGLGFTVEMRPLTGKFANFNDFAPPPDQILPNAEENYKAVEVALEWSLNRAKQ